MCQAARASKPGPASLACAVPHGSSPPPPRRAAPHAPPAVPVWATCEADTARDRRASDAARSAASGGGELKGVIEKLLLREDLSAAETEATLDAMLAGADATQAAAFLVLLRAKGETAAEVAGLARGTWVPSSSIGSI